MVEKGKVQESSRLVKEMLKGELTLVFFKLTRNKINLFFQDMQERPLKNGKERNEMAKMYTYRICSKRGLSIRSAAFCEQSLLRSAAQHNEFLSF